MKNFTSNQVECALSDIGNKARIARTLCIEAVAADPADINTQADLIVAAQTIIEQIGWIADHHSDPTFRQRGGAPEWLLPPVYHEKPDTDQD